MTQVSAEDDIDGPEAPAGARPRKRHPIRWTLLGLAALLVAAGVAAWMAVNATPGWYKLLIAGKASDAENARQVQDKVAAVQDWSDAVYKHEYSRSRQTPRGVPPADELTIAFSQDQINAFLHKWWAFYGRQQQVDGDTLDAAFADPAVRLEDGQVTIAGRVKAIADGKVIGVHFRPTMTGDSKLHLTETGISAGVLSVPDALWARSRSSLVRTMKQMIASDRPAARIDAGGAANSAAVSVLLLGMAVDTLENRAAGDTLLLPLAFEGRNERAIPVRLKSLSVQNGQITLTVQYLSLDQRQALLNQLRIAR